MSRVPLAVRLRGSRPSGVENLVAYATVSSTNDAARRLVSAWPEDLPLPATLVVALEQTAGRGREGRVWRSPTGEGIYASVLWPLADRRSVAAMPLAVAVGLCEAMRSFGVRECGVKWPNDLMVGDRKLGGILIEVLGPPRGPVTAIVGFGINMKMDREKLASLKATSIQSETGSVPSLAEAVCGCTRAVCCELGGLERRTTLAARYRDRVVHRPGDRLLWRQGGSVVEGRFRAIDSSGCLELETESGVRIINAGEIVIE